MRLRAEKNAWQMMMPDRSLKVNGDLDRYTLPLAIEDSLDAYCSFLETLIRVGCPISTSTF